MFGAIIGDIIGSIYEFDNIKTKDFPLFSQDCFFTDDTVMSCAVAASLVYGDTRDINRYKEGLIALMHDIGNRYIRCGYGDKFGIWIATKMKEPYNSYGNGSAMRVSPVIWYANSLEEAERLAKATAEVTHNHTEGIKGAVATAGSGWLARNGATKEEIARYIRRYYDINFTVDEIRPTYKFNETCQGSVPQALVAFLESDSFEDAIRNAISIGGDSDTIAAITGAIAEAFYGIPYELKEKASIYLDGMLLGLAEQFADMYVTY